MFKIKKNILVKIIVLLIFIFPYIEIEAVRKTISFSIGDTNLSPSLSIMLVLYIPVMILNRKYRKASINNYFNRNSRSMLLFLIVSVFNLIYRQQGYINFSIILRFFVPYFFSVEIIKLVLNNRFFQSEILTDSGPKYYLIVQLIFLVANVLLFGFTLDGQEESRMISTGGGPVVLGYTITLVTSFWISLSTRESSIVKIFILGSSVLLSISTGSRGSMWPLLLLVILFVVSKKKNIDYSKMVFLLLFTIISVILVDSDSIIELVPRLLQFGDSARFSSIADNLQLFKNFNLTDSVFGRGLSEIYPIYIWEINKNGFIDYNKFYYEGFYLLVQPHNTYIYLLLETGLVGITLFLRTIYVYSKSCGKVHGLIIKQFTFVLIFICFIESVFVITPGTAFLWWILLMSFGYLLQKTNDL